MLDWTMVALFALAAIVQFNDPDPLRWIALYGGSCLASAHLASGRRPIPLIPVLIAIVAVVWAAAIALSGLSLVEYRDMFDEWEMRDARVEAAREATGLMIVAAWMTVLAWRGRRIVASP